MGAEQDDEMCLINKECKRPIAKMTQWKFNSSQQQKHVKSRMSNSMYRLLDHI